MMTIRFVSQAVAVAFATLTVFPALAQDSFGQASQQPQQQQQQQFPQGQQQFPQGQQQFPQGQQQLPQGQQQLPQGQQQFPQGQQQFPQGQQFPQQPPQPYPQPAPNGGGAAPSAGAGGQPGFGAPPAAGGAANLDQLAQIERQDFGVPATPQLHAGEMHGPTPASIPGGQVITTKGLVDLVRGGQAPVLVLDVLGGPEMIQGAQYAVPAAQSGSFSDQTQQQLAQYLQQATAGSKQYPIVLYCLSPQCWMSYNAALRAINLGYTNVLWYRGGIESWKQAGMPVQRVQ